MFIERLSIKFVTINIFLMISVAAVILSMLAGSYFKQSALDAQINSLSRVIEVATDQMMKEIRNDAFNLGMSFVQNPKLTTELQNALQHGSTGKLISLLDDPFINGFVGISKITLEKIRIYTPDLELITESTSGIEKLPHSLPTYLQQQLSQRHGVDRLKSLDALWISSSGPLHSTIVPVGGLNLQGYLEVIIDPAPNLPDISKITRTPVSIFSASGELLWKNMPVDTNQHLPVRFPLLTSNGDPAFLIMGYENIKELADRMDHTQITTTFYFLVLIFLVLLFALWLFHRYLFVPTEQLVTDMKRLAAGKGKPDTNKKGLLEFHTLATTFDDMCRRIKIKTQELTMSQNRLLRLLDLDDNAILYFGSENELVYANKGACILFGYHETEIKNLHLSDLFKDDIEKLLSDYVPVHSTVHREFQTRLHCLQRDGSSLTCDAIISSLSTSGDHGYAIALRNLKSDSKPVENETEATQKRMAAVEQSLNSLLDIARNNPILLGTYNNLPEQRKSGSKTELRDYTLNVMHTALTCWEHDMGKSKLQLAEESNIWPVYIDKSTPTTRTLDKYLHPDTCPKNPRYQRVIDTAEFVLKQTANITSPHREKLETALQQLRDYVTGHNG